MDDDDDDTRDKLKYINTLSGVITQLVDDISRTCNLNTNSEVFKQTMANLPDIKGRLEDHKNYGRILRFFKNTDISQELKMEDRSDDIKLLITSLDKLKTIVSPESDCHEELSKMVPQSLVVIKQIIKHYEDKYVELSKTSGETPTPDETSQAQNGGNYFSEIKNIITRKSGGKQKSKRKYSKKQKKSRRARKTRK
jgi:hypothetical protein